MCGHETPDLEESDSQVSKCAGNKQICSDNTAHHRVVSTPTGPPNSCEEAAEQTVPGPVPGVPTIIEPDNHVNTLSRSDRVQIGQKCKRLIDFGRQQWMSAQGFQVCIYVISCTVANCGHMHLKVQLPGDSQHEGISLHCTAALASRV